MLQVLSSVRLYLLVVLLPQVVYLLTNSYGWAAVCESCSPSTYMDMYLRLLQDPSSFSAAKSSDTSHQTMDNASTEENSEESISLVKGGGVDSVHNSHQRSVDNSQTEVMPTMSLCSCSNQEFNNLSNDKQVHASLQSDPDRGGWYV